jgi:hypothetical protein
LGGGKRKKERNAHYLDEKIKKDDGILSRGRRGDCYVCPG